MLPITSTRLGMAIEPSCPITSSIDVLAVSRSSITSTTGAFAEMAAIQGTEYRLMSSSEISSSRRSPAAKAEIAARTVFDLGRDVGKGLDDDLELVVGER